MQRAYNRPAQTQLEGNIFQEQQQSSLNIEFVKPWRPICCLTGLLCSKTRTLRWICISPSRSSAVPSPIPLRQQFHIYIYSCIFFPFVMRCLQYQGRERQSYRMPVKVRGGQRYWNVPSLCVVSSAGLTLALWKWMENCEYFLNFPTNFINTPETGVRLRWHRSTEPGTLHKIQSIFHQMGWVLTLF